MATPKWSLRLLPPYKMSLDIAGAAVESPRAMSGITQAVDYSGSGYRIAKYQQIQLWRPEQHRYWKQMAAYLRGGVRSVVVPLLTDWTVPVINPGIDPIRYLTPHSDKTSFSDSALYSQSAVQASLTQDAALNSATILITVFAGGGIYGGETFSIAHTTKGPHCYDITEVDGATSPDPVTGAVTYQIGIAPNLREFTSAVTLLKFDRPECLMRLAPGTSMPWEPEGYWQSKPDVSFVESFALINSDSTAVLDENNVTILADA